MISSALKNAEMKTPLEKDRLSCAEHYGIDFGIGFKGLSMLLHAARKTKFSFVPKYLRSFLCGTQAGIFHWDNMQPWGSHTLKFS